MPHIARPFLSLFIAFIAIFGPARAASTDCKDELITNPTSGMFLNSDLPFLPNKRDINRLRWADVHFAELAA